MRRREFIAALCGAAAWPVMARGQESPRIWRVGFLSAGFDPLSNPAHATNFEAFRQQMQNLGYVEGKNVKIEGRYAEGQPDRLSVLANELASLPCDVIVAVTTPAIAAAQRATSRIPIVMSPASDPIGSGFVKSLAHPGGNITGVANLYDESMSKSVEFLHAVLPNTKKIAVLLSSTFNPVLPPSYEKARAAAQSLGISAVLILAPTPADLDSAFREIVKENCDALVMIADTNKPISSFAAAYKIPEFYQISTFVDLGGLASYGANLPAMFSLAATYVDKILKGADPADLPVEQPTIFEFVLNLRRAKSLGLSIPESVILRADRIIE
jgi:putative ABC transport system substrate-binding protein